MDWLCVEAAAFFLVEKDDGVGGEVFALGGGDGGWRRPLLRERLEWCRLRFAREISASVLPLARTRKPKSLRRRVSRLSDQVFWCSPGGLVSQYPAKAKCGGVREGRRRRGSCCCRSRWRLRCGLIGGRVLLGCCARIARR